jgi:DNA-binding winged helix-turn-helix (wHTH) protein
VAAEPLKSSWKRDVPFRLGDVEVLPASGEIRTPRGVERLRPLLMDILLRLAAEPGAVVRRETLLEDVWRRRMVNDEVLSRAMAELRTTLGDDARVPRYIETLPKLGYRLVAAVSRAPAPLPGNDALPLRASRHPAAIPGLLLVAAAIGTAGWWALRAQPAPFAQLERRLTLARPLTSDPERELSPRFSPDGKHVAFALAGRDAARIVVQSIDGGARQVVDGPGGEARMSPAFFPDGKRIAYWKGSDADCSIVERDLETGRERTLLDCAMSPRARFDLSADGRWIVFSGTARQQEPATLWVLDLAGSAPQPLTTSEKDLGDDIVPRFSPDAKQVAFFRGNASQRTPWVVTRGDPASAHAVAKLEGLSYGFAWLGRDGPLLVAADWFGFRALNLLDVASGKARLVGARGARYPDAGPSGELVFENAVYTANLWSVDPVAGPAKEPSWPSTRYSNEPEFSPDAARLAFASNRDGADALYVATEGGEARRIAFGEGYRYLRPHWSPDGRSIYAVRTLAAAGSASPSEAVRVAATGGPAEVLAALGRSVGDVREGPGGMLYWGEAADHALRLMRAPLADLAHPERLPLPLVSHYQVSGGRLAFTQPHLDKMTLCRLETLACAPLGIGIAPSGALHWALTPGGLYARTVSNGTLRLARFDLATQAMTRQWDIAPGGAGSSIAVSADERHIVVAKEEDPAIDLMIAR